MAKKKSSGSKLTTSQLDSLISDTYTNLANHYAANNQSLNQSLSAQQLGATVTSGGSGGLGQLGNPNMVNVPWTNPYVQQYSSPQSQYGYTTQTVPNPLTSMNLCVGCYPTARMPAMFFFQGNSLCEKCFIIKKEEKQNLENALGNALASELKKTLKKKFSP